MIFKKKGGCCLTCLPLSLATRFEIFLIRRIYQPFFSPVFGRQCRFFPTCSNYAIDALHKDCFWRANFRIFYRILRCNPFCKGGYDPA